MAAERHRSARPESHTDRMIAPAPLRRRAAAARGYIVTASIGALAVGYLLGIQRASALDVQAAQKEIEVARASFRVMQAKRRCIEALRTAARVEPADAEEIAEVWGARGDRVTCPALPVEEPSILADVVGRTRPVDVWRPANPPPSATMVASVDP